MPRHSKYSEAKEDERRKSISVTGHLNKLTEIQKKLDKECKALTATQVAGMRLNADISIAMLKKVLPDLQAIEHTGEIVHSDVTDKPMSADDWQKQYENSLGATERASESTH